MLAIVQGDVCPSLVAQRAVDERPVALERSEDTLGEGRVGCQHGLSDAHGVRFVQLTVDAVLVVTEPFDTAQLHELLGREREGVERDVPLAGGEHGAHTSRLGRRGADDDRGQVRVGHTRFSKR